MEGRESKIAFHPSTHFLKKKNNFSFFYFQTLYPLLSSSFRGRKRLGIAVFSEFPGTLFSLPRNFDSRNPTYWILTSRSFFLRASLGISRRDFRFSLFLSPTFSFAPWRNDFARSGNSFSVSLVSKTLSRVLARFSVIRSWLLVLVGYGHSLGSGKLWQSRLTSRKN